MWRALIKARVNQIRIDTIYRCSQPPGDVGEQAHSVDLGRKTAVDDPR